MQDGIFGPLQAFNRTINQMLSCLRQHLDCYIVRNMAPINKFAKEIKISVRGRGKPHLNFFEAHFNKHFEHTHFTHGIHRLNQRLIAITQINRTPGWCFIDGLRWPGAVFKLNSRKWLVFFMAR